MTWKKGDTVCSITCPWWLCWSACVCSHVWCCLISWATCSLSHSLPEAKLMLLTIHAAANTFDCRKKKGWSERLGGKATKQTDGDNMWEVCSDRDEKWSLAKQRDVADGAWYLYQGLTKTPLKYLRIDLRTVRQQLKVLSFQTAFVQL